MMLGYGARMGANRFQPVRIAVTFSRIYRKAMKATKTLADYLFGWDAPSEEIRAKLVEHRHGSTRIPVIFANILVAGAVTGTLWQMKPHGLLLGWLAGVTCIALLIAQSIASYARKKSEHTAQYWAYRLSLGGLLNGTVWGIGALLLFDPATPSINILMIGVICGMTAGTVMTSFAIPGSAYAYLIPAILLSMLMPLTQGSFVDHAMALLWVPYLAVMVILTRSAHKALAQSIILSYENARLAMNLAVAKERAERLARAKSDFLAVMSHEIRTPMHGMLGVAELLSNTHLDPKQKMYLEHLRGAGEYLSQLLNNILDFSKIEAEKLVLNEAPFSLTDLVGEVVGLFSLQAHRKGLIFEAIFPDNVAPLWLGDSHRLKQVFINLLGNAFKFTEFGSIKLEITADGHSDDKTCFRFRVIDTGPGISPDLISTLFDPFTQETSSPSHNYGGTGLGLAISKRLVDAMGGQLTVESKVGHGSEFSFTLLLAPADLSDLPAVAKLPLDEGAALPPARILLADDSPFNRLVVQGFLAETPCTIDEAEDGQQAVQMYQHTAYDIVLMDMRMPVMTGIDAVRNIRSWEADQHRKPSMIIMLTASVFDSDRIAVMAAGCNEILTKPVQKETLIRLLRKNADGQIAATA